MIYINFWLFMASSAAICATGISTRRNGPTEEFESHEVVVIDVYHKGQIVTSTEEKGRFYRKLTLEVKRRTKNITLELRQNRELFRPNYIERHFLPDGNEHINKPDKTIANHCHYHGNVHGNQAYVAAFSTCDGIKGSFSDGEDTYHIEPKEEGSVVNYYLLKETDRRISQDLHCGYEESHTELGGHIRKRMKRMIKEPYDSNKNTKLVELYVVNDKTQFLKYENHIGIVIRKTQEIVNHVNSIYRPLGIYVALVGVEIWNIEDKIAIMGNSSATLENFLQYRKYQITPRFPNDNAQLLTGQDLGQGVWGKARVQSMCSWQHSGGINKDHNWSAAPVATTMAHELGHNFGMRHDTDSCRCPDTRCIMASSGGGHNPTQWSSCSKEQLEEALEENVDLCLHDLPSALSVNHGDGSLTIGIPGDAVCGNGFMEDGEECDCGLPEDCDTKCCNATLCKLTANAVCATGGCCDLSTCQLKSASTLCRPSSGFCDLEEGCIGDKESCPSDVYKQDGTPCTNNYGEAYCYQGRCESRQSQCSKLYGPTAKEANQMCYEKHNVVGTDFGHCGYNWVKDEFTKCAIQDSQCGMLQCVHQTEKLYYWEKSLIKVQTRSQVYDDGRRFDCQGIIMDVGIDNKDPGMVPDGAPCGENRMCVRSKCVPPASVQKAKCPDCNGRGVCSSLGQCHCDAGYAPPYCDGAGNGGSLHSGPVYYSSNWKLVLGLCILFLVIVVVALFIVIYNRKKLMEKCPALGYRVRSIRRQSFVMVRKSSLAPSVSLNNILSETTDEWESDNRHRPNTPNRKKALKVPKPLPSVPNKRGDISKPTMESHTNSYLDTAPPAWNASRADPSSGQSHTYETTFPSYASAQAGQSQIYINNQDGISKNSNNLNSTVPKKIYKPKLPANIAFLRPNVPRSKQSNLSSTQVTEGYVPLSKDEKHGKPLTPTAPILRSPKEEHLYDNRIPGRLEEAGNKGASVRTGVSGGIGTW